MRNYFQSTFPCESLNKLTDAVRSGAINHRSVGPPPLLLCFVHLPTNVCSQGVYAEHHQHDAGLHNTGGGVSFELGRVGPHTDRHDS